MARSVFLRVHGRLPWGCLLGHPLGDRRRQGHHGWLNPFSIVSGVIPDPVGVRRREGGLRIGAPPQGHLMAAIEHSGTPVGKAELSRIDRGAPNRWLAEACSETSLAIVGMRGTVRMTIENRSGFIDRFVLACQVIDLRKGLSSRYNLSHVGLLACQPIKGWHPSGHLSQRCFLPPCSRLGWIRLDAVMPRKWLVRYLRGKWQRENVPSEPPAAIVPPVPCRPSYPYPRLPSLSTAIRDYAWAVEANVLDRKSEADIDRWAAAMGPEIWAWQRARLLTDQPPWRASPDADEEHERRRANDCMLQDVTTWEKALVLLDGRIRRARLYDRPVPPPLIVPQEVMALIEAKRAAALQRVSKARTRGEGGGSPPGFTPDDDLSHPPFPSKPR